MSNLGGSGMPPPRKIWVFYIVLGYKICYKVYTVWIALNIHTEYYSFFCTVILVQDVTHTHV